MSRLSIAPSTENGSDFMGKGGVPVATDYLNTDPRNGSEESQRFQNNQNINNNSQQ